ncbi:penicillin-insensitive murein endopeptidase [Plesiocystis pacifica SIR-1]|uniref:Penicillin-insensitive murein endopeptidase n=1 Tax=Plesiocystis pacifica SIR-1 TaxID=391625 RepID=A6G007_9BACT|nr:penicillin-insensitive murein endopeptidase [Plesiocystis pacifica]EDM80704.1 penicillin-insensitive murein endopeptidase [Plesiocystis pacifica SIR-1]
MGSALVFAALLLGACATPGRWTDYTSVSVGKSNEGRIHRPVKMRPRGRGFLVPSTWRERGNQWGTTELVGMVERAAGKVRDQKRATLGVADLSPKRGGKSIWHASHQSGRDVDLIFYTVDERGKTQPPPEVEMVHFDGSGEPFIPRHMRTTGYEEPTWETRRFDDARNWLLIEALLSDRAVRVQWIFVSNALEARMLRWAERHDRPRWLIEYGREIMRQPGASAPHDDHFHVRVYCSRADRALGCEDTGPIWQHEKKTYKYAGPERYDPNLTRALLARPMFFFHG